MRCFSILSVDDKADLSTGINDRLTSDGYKVTRVHADQHFFDSFSAKVFDLVLLNLALPELDNARLCRRIRAGTKAPMLMITARDKLPDIVLGLESGADDYMARPFDYLELAARIRALLRRSYTYNAAGSLKMSGLFTLNPNMRTVSFNGKRIRLTGKEYALLSLLVEHAGQSLDRETIRKALWPDNALYRWSRTIDVHIQHLRIKIESDPRAPRYIHTVQGIGYLLINE